MNLPGPNSNINWKDYQIDTPTFQLSPIEKPDLSPFLIHMTGRNQLINILRGENIPEGKDISKGFGFLKSSIPDYNGSQRFYNSSVVCFTESPLFALDFFRYRSYYRWNSDQQYGIGFSKSDLVKQYNVRPVIYLDTQTNAEVLSICSKILDESLVITNTEGIIEDLKPIMEKIKPLLFPLLEENHYQGFMWEREWRYPKPEGLVFSLSTIKVICCPNNERAEIEDLLKDYLKDIQIVETWREYDDITSFLKRRKSQTNIKATDNFDQIKDINILKKLKQQNDQTYHSLFAYYTVFKETVEQLEGKSINDTLIDIQKTSILISEQLEKVEKEIKTKEEQAKQKK